MNQQNINKNNSNIDIKFKIFTEEIKKILKENKSEIREEIREIKENLNKTKIEIKTYIENNFVKKSDINHLISKKPSSGINGYIKRESNRQEFICENKIYNYLTQYNKSMFYFIPNRNIIPREIFQIKNNKINESKQLTDIDGIVIGTNNIKLRKFNKGLQQNHSIFLNNTKLESEITNENIMNNKNGNKYIMYVIESKNDLTAQKIKNKIIQIIKFTGYIEYLKSIQNSLIKKNSVNIPTKYITIYKKYKLLCKINKNDIKLIFCSNYFQNIEEFKNKIQHSFSNLSYWTDRLSEDEIKFLNEKLKNNILFFSSDTEKMYNFDLEIIQK